MLHGYAQHDIEQCLQHRAIVFVGDSTVRQLFWAIAKRLNGPRAQEMEAAAQKHSDATFEHEGANLHFLWDPYLNSSSESGWLGLEKGSYLHWNATSVLATVFGSGLWYARHLGDQYLDMYRSQVRSLMGELVREPHIVTANAVLPPAYLAPLNRTPVFLPIIQPDVGMSDEGRLRTLTAENLGPMNNFLAAEAAASHIDLFQSFGTMVASHPLPFAPDGLHLSKHLTSAQANMLLNFLCNSQAVLQKPPYDKTCCNVAPGNNLSTNIAIVPFVVLLLLAAIAKLRCVPAAYWVCRDDGSAMHLVVISSAVIYCFITDRSPLFEKINKPVNLIGFVILLICGSVAGLTFTSRQPAGILPIEKNASTQLSQGPFLSRQQSEEWKGWMQLVILIYHYFGMSKVLWVYQVARLLVASYLFMTGFGHTTYFLKMKDFSIKRITSILLRLNMLSCILGYVMLSSYDFYYFSVLCSFWSLVVFCTLGVGFGGDINAGGIIARCLVSIICVKSFIHVPGILEGLSTALHLCCRIDFHAQEFRFRVGLDLCIVYIGILVGWLHHGRQGAAICSWLESNSSWCQRLRWTTDNNIVPLSVLKATCVIVLCGYLLLIGCFSDKYQYNRLHPWISPIFVLAYILLRNSSRRLRETHSPLFACLGRCSLETYILQCHIWLAADAKGLLRLGLLNKTRTGTVVECIVITVFFFWTSWHVSRATGAITAAILGLKTATSSRAIVRRVMIVAVTLVAVNWLLEVLPREMSHRWTQR
jgi:hypothetical protein